VLLVASAVVAFFSFAALDDPAGEPPIPVPARHHM
jgi:hypothetical protein